MCSEASRRKGIRLRENSGKDLTKTPSIVNAYMRFYRKMATQKYKTDLLVFARSELKHPIEGLDWKQLLDWEHKHIRYTKEKPPKPRARLPIDIIRQAKGLCGEFTLLYNGLLLANNYQTRMVLDCSSLRDKTKKVAGDHVWVEVFLDDAWVHVDPTERRINKPSMYALEWNKDVNLVYAVTEKEIVDVTKTYKPEDRARSR
jgi:hypothetical protein